jgi:hypothetical protein
VFTHVPSDRRPDLVFSEPEQRWATGTLFGLTNTEGNHGEDVKEYYFYLDNLPTHSYQRYLYKYPQAKFPYANLVG